MTAQVLFLDVFFEKDLHPDAVEGRKGLFINYFFSTKERKK